jgi:Fe-S cluster assembly protein SufD
MTLCTKYLILSTQKMAFKENILATYKDEKSPLGEIRQSAKQQLEALELPTRKNEDWKFTNVKALDKTTYSFQESSLTNEQLTSVEIEDLDAYKIFLVNGVFDIENSVLPTQNKITVSTMVEALADESVLAYFNQNLNNENELFSAVSTALFKDGYYIKVEKNTVLDKPVIVYHINDATSSEVVSLPRNLILAEENSQATIIESFHTLGENASLTNAVTEIVAGVSSNIAYYKLQNEVKTASHIGTTEVTIKDKAVFNAYTFTLSGDIVRNNLNFKLDGEHIEAHMYGLYMIDGKTHVDNHTVADHLKPNCFSNELYKGIMDDSSNGVFNGIVFVRPDAQKTNAFQSNKNILLTDNAKVNAKPQLEIWADDVSCSHGCTTGQLDQDAIFFFRQRGISLENARKLLLEAFAVEVINYVKVDAVKDYLAQIVHEKLS